ncbi:MAG TPA: hypothetical protein VG869_13245 [Acidimicrobiia bacterium]|jgi:hypothetical protein|nr:hypothetical protein [Acidimicrobiia bacterium]
MVTGLAFVATAVASLFAESTLAAATQQRRRRELWDWTVALALFALAAAALALGTSNGWDRGTYRVFFLLGAVLDVPWLALGTVDLLLGPRAGRRAQWFVVFFSGLAAGVIASAPMRAVAGTRIPVASRTFGAFPRALAAVGSGIGATVILVGAVLSAVRFARDRTQPGNARRAVANGLIAAGTLVLSSGGLVQGFLGHDEAFAATLAAGIVVVYAGFRVAGRRRRTPSTASP